MSARVRAALPWLYLGGLIWLNAYLVRHVFTLTYTGATHSMHGYWMALGRVMGNSWLVPQWVPYWAGGMPAELTYSPLVPWLGWHFGLYAVLAGIFAIGPAALYLMAWQISGKPAWAFVAGAFYSLCSLVDLVLPEAAWQWAKLLEAQRMYLTLIWDEAPHQLALAMVCLAVAAWARGWVRPAVLAIVIAALANPFGVTGAALFGLCWALAYGRFRIVAVCGVLGYLIVSPFYPPSLLPVLRANGAIAPESVWTGGSWVALAGVGAGAALLRWGVRGWQPMGRFLALLVFVISALPVIYTRWNIVLLQQPARYRNEMEVALVLAVVFGAERLLRRRPRWVLALLAVAGIWAGTMQTIRHRRFSRSAIRQAAAEASIEARAARAAQGTVFTSGSLAHWMNAYRDVRQYSGGSYTTAPNTVQQRIGLELTGEPSWERFVLWMRAAGVDQVILPGRGSPEFWKPFARDVLAGHLPVRWEEEDTRIYAVPRTRRTMVHSIPALVALEPYVAAMEDPAAPVLSMEWLGAGHGVVRGAWREGDMVLIHMNWHRNWKALLDGKPVPTGADGLGQLVVVPGGAGRLEVRYQAGLEEWATRALAVAAIAISLLAGRDRLSGGRPSSAPA